MRLSRRSFFALLAVLPLSSATADDVRALLVNRVEEAKKAVGIVAGTIGPEGRQVVAAGKMAKDSDRAPDGDTVFEIGSITKVFTSLVLADMVERGEVKLDDPVAKFLPPDVKVPARNGRQITLLDLSMQVSGLPRMPNNFAPRDFANPYADYDASKLYAFLSSYTLARDPGERYDYSNLGVGLLGHALARRAGTSYEEMVRKRILEPLGMTSSSITLSADQRKRLATGHDATLKPVKNWDLDALAGAGALRSTVNDMLKFLAANMELTDTPLKAAMRRMRSVRNSAGIPSIDIAMAWHVSKKEGSEIWWHNGGTGGYRSWAGFDPVAKRGAVVLCNTFFAVDDLGAHFVDSSAPVGKLQPPRERVVIAVDPKILETYVGTYRLAPEFSIAIVREENRLFAQATNQPRFEIFAEKENEFFLRVVDAQLTFVKDEAGKITHLILHQNGMNQKAVRVE